MKRFLLDSGMAGDFVNKRRGVYERARGEARAGHRVGTCTPVVGELSYGVEYSASRDRNAERLQRMLRELVIWSFDRAAAGEYGRLFAELRRRGRIMQQIDVQVAAVARTLGRCVVVSGDGDLSAVPGLDVEDWSE